MAIVWMLLIDLSGSRSQFVKESLGWPGLQSVMRRRLKGGHISRYFAGFRKETNSVEQFEFDSRFLVVSELKDMEPHSDRVLRPRIEGQHLDRHSGNVRDLSQAPVLLSHHARGTHRSPENGLVEYHGASRRVIPTQNPLPHAPQACLSSHHLEWKIGSGPDQLPCVALGLEKSGNQIRLVSAEHDGVVLKDEQRLERLIDQIGVRIPPAPIPYLSRLAEKFLPAITRGSVQIEQAADFRDTDGREAGLDPQESRQRVFQARRGLLLGSSRLHAQAAKRGGHHPPSRDGAPIAVRHPLHPHGRLWPVIRTTRKFHAGYLHMQISYREPSQVYG
jgi:hypothetical protein